MTLSHLKTIVLLSQGSQARAAATQNLIELNCCKLKKIYALCENFIYIGLLPVLSLGRSSVPGLAGLTGLTGLTGLMRLTGLTGLTGLVGLTGLMGLVGLVGLTWLAVILSRVKGLGAHKAQGSPPRDPNISI